MISGIDKNEVNLDEIKSLFIDCKELNGKPTLFFVQACRGRKDPEAVKVDESQIREAGMVKKAKDADVFQFFPTTPRKFVYKLIPCFPLPK